MYICAINVLTLVLQFKRGEISHDQIKGEAIKDDIILDKKQLFVSFIVRNQVISLLDDETITQREAENFCYTCVVFHRKPFFILHGERCYRYTSSEKVPPCSKKVKERSSKLSKERLMKHLNY